MEYYFVLVTIDSNDPLFGASHKYFGLAISQNENLGKSMLATFEEITKDSPYPQERINYNYGKIWESNYNSLVCDLWKIKDGKPLLVPRENIVLDEPPKALSETINSTGANHEDGSMLNR